MLDRCFELIESLTETEKSSLYYIAGYVAKKEDSCAVNGTDGESNPHPPSEFTSLVSRGKLSHPTAELFNLAYVLYCYYKNANKECIEYLMVAFLEIYDCCFLDYISKEKVLRRHIN